MSAASGLERARLGRTNLVVSNICFGASSLGEPERVRQTLDWAAWRIPDCVRDELMALPFSTEDPEATR